MSYTLGQAAKAAGKSKPTILRAIQKGSISATKDGLGRWVIEPSELHRVYPSVKRHDVDGGETGLNDALQQKISLLETELEARRRETDAAQQTIEDLRQDRDIWRQEARRFMRLVEGPPRLTWWQRVTGPRREPMLDKDKNEAE